MTSRQIDTQSRSPYSFALDALVLAAGPAPTRMTKERARMRERPPRRGRSRSLYSAEQRDRRDRSVWTDVQGVLAPLQFAVFIVSLALVLHFLLTGSGREAAALSVVVKTATLYAIMITGSIWEKDVFGKYLFAEAFFWEDLFSLLVLALHTAYIVAFFLGFLDAQGLMLLALAAYAAYVVNAAQFLLKLRAARLEQSPRRRFGESVQPGLTS
jgi:3-vinyl bacteriochlorophyllide hydratase